MKKLLFIFVLLPFGLQAQSHTAFDIRSADQINQADPFTALVLRMENPCSDGSPDQVDLQNGQGIDTGDTACMNYQKLLDASLETNRDSPGQQEQEVSEKSLLQKPWFIGVCVVTAAALVVHYSTM